MLPNYNILTEAGSSFGYKHTELDRIKMKSIYNIKHRLRIDNLIKDKTTIKFSEKSLLYMKKNSKPIILYNLDNTVFGEYNSITDAAKTINCGIKTIARALKTDKKLVKRRFIVKYIEKK